MTAKDRNARVAGVGLAFLVVAAFVVGGGSAAIPSLSQETTAETTTGQEETTTMRFGETTTTDVSQGGDANVRIAHVSPDAPEVNVLVDGRAIARNIAFENVSEYLPVEPGSHTITVLRAANNVSLGNDTVSFEAERNYTVAVVGEFSDNGTTALRPLVLRDDAATPDADSVAVRFVHASPDIGPVDVTINETGRVLFDGATFGTGTPYRVLPAGDYEFEIRRATEENAGPVLAQFAVSFDGTGGYSTFLTGYDTVGDSPSDELLNLSSVVDIPPEDVAEESEVDGTETTANGTTVENGTTENGTATESETTGETETTGQTQTTAGAETRAGS